MQWVVANRKDVSRGLKVVGLFEAQRNANAFGHPKEAIKAQL